MTPEEYLKSHQISYIHHEHPAVFTCEDAERLCVDVPGLACKNLFLRNKKTDRFFLLILPAKKRTDLKQFSKIVNESKITFANAEQLKNILQLEPGSVSPLGLINDTNHEVEVYIDQELHKAEIVNFHPNRNTASLEFSREMFQKFLETLSNKITIVKTQ